MTDTQTDKLFIITHSHTMIIIIIIMEEYQFWSLFCVLGTGGFCGLRRYVTLLPLFFTSSTTISYLPCLSPSYLPCVWCCSCSSSVTGRLVFLASSSSGSGSSGGRRKGRSILLQHLRREVLLYGFDTDIPQLLLVLLIPIPL